MNRSLHQEVTKRSECCLNLGDHNCRVLVTTLRGGCDNEAAGARLQSLAGEPDDGVDLVVGEFSGERRHLVAAIGDDGELVGRVRILGGDRALVELGTGAALTRTLRGNRRSCGRTPLGPERAPDRSTRPPERPRRTPRTGRRRPSPTPATSSIRAPATTGLRSGGGGRSVCGRCHTAPMGFDPHRKHKASRFDYIFVAAAFVGGHRSRRLGPRGLGRAGAIEMPSRNRAREAAKAAAVRPAVARIGREEQEAQTQGVEDETGALGQGHEAGEATSHRADARPVGGRRRRDEVRPALRGDEDLCVSRLRPRHFARVWVTWWRFLPTNPTFGVTGIVAAGPTATPATESY